MVKQRKVGGNSKKSSEPKQEKKPQREQKTKTDHLDRVKKSPNRSKHYIGRFHEAEDHAVYNNNIYSGYRIKFDSYGKVVKSLFMVHNETTNIWSHLIGFVFVLILVIYVGYSYNLTDIQQNLSEIQHKLNVKYDQYHDQFLNFEAKIMEAVNENRENFIQNFDRYHSQFSSFIGDLKQLKNENFEKFAEQLRELPDKFKEYQNVLRETFSSNETFSSLLQTLNLTERIDSEEYDWIDIVWYLRDLNLTPEQKLILHHKTSVSRWPVVLFLITALICLMFSATYHAVYVISAKVNSVFLRLDYAGVNFLISGSVMPLCYYGFYCDGNTSTNYIAMSCTACFIVFIVSLKDFIHTPEYIVFKNWMYALLGIFCAIPLFHLALKESFAQNSLDNYSTSPSLFYYTIMGACYLGGLYIFTVKWPENRDPGKYDLCGASHQIWHFSILIAIVFTYFGAIINYHTRVENICPVVEVTQ